MPFSSYRLIVLVLFASALAVAQKAPLSQPAGSVGGVSEPWQSSTDQTISTAKKQLALSPKRLQSFNEVALAYVKRSRERSDSNFLEDADKAATQGLAVDGNDFQLLKTKALILLARHRWTEARKLAAELNKRTPDDVATYGYLAEADFELGDYPAAEVSAQWMLNMLRNNVPGLVIGARLRNMYGDADGAIELLRMASAETSPFEQEELAWIANQVAVIQLESGKVEDAARSLDSAGQLLANYVPTLRNLAQVRIEQGRPADAVALLKETQEQDKDPHLAYLLARALQAAGKPSEAQNALVEFQKAVVRQTGVVERDEAQLDRIRLLAEDPMTAAESLKLAQNRFSERQDVWTTDALACSLQANGKLQEADSTIQKALGVGVKSARIFDHAGHIARSLSHAEVASKYFRVAAKADYSEFALDARQSMNPADKADEAGASKSMPTPANALPPAPPQGRDVAYTKSLTTSTVTNGLLPFSSVPEMLMVPRPTDTDRLIQHAQTLAVQNPNDPKNLSVLGAAHFQRARETGDVSDYQKAEDALTRSLNLLSTDFSAVEPLATMAEVCMGEHRFSDALGYSQKALSLGSGDVSSFAIVGDAYADMGAYHKAAQAYSRLTPQDMTLAPRAAYARDSRLAYLKFVNGDTDGAVALMKTSVEEGVEARLPSENLAWLYYELGEFLVLRGDAAAADAAYLQALSVHPGDYRALASMAKLRSNLGKTQEAMLLYQHAIAIVPMPMFVAELGDLYSRNGKQDEAKKQYQLVEYIGLLGEINQVLHNRDLAIFYADHDLKLNKALELARKEFEVREDLYTWDTLAWVLYKNGRYADAATASQNALKLGTKDPILLYHAGMIANKMGKPDEARTHLSEALKINPHFHLLYADAAQQELARLSAQVASKERDAR